MIYIYMHTYVNFFLCEWTVVAGLMGYLHVIIFDHEETIHES